MEKQMKAAVLAAALTGSLVTGCGSKQEHMNQNAEAPRHAVTEAAKVTDRDHSLYEEDDVHRKTDESEPDIIDRADSLLDSAEEYIENIATDAERALDSMTE